MERVKGGTIYAGYYVYSLVEGTMPRMVGHGIDL